MKRRRIIQGIVALLGLVLLLVIAPSKSADVLLEQYGDEFNRTLDIEHLTVHYRDQGSGPVFVLLHGTASSLLTWEGWTKELEGEYRIVRPDLPGFGLTGPHPQRRYDMEAYVEFLDAFLDGLGLESVALAGNSLGGNIAWNYAAAHPERVHRLVLVDPAGFVQEQHISLAFRLASIPILRGMIKWVSPRPLIRGSLEEVYHDPSLVSDTLVGQYRDMSLRRGNRQAFIDRVNTPAEDRTALLAVLSMPVLLQWGASDAWIPVEHAELFREAIPHARLIVYPNAGHVPMEELPVESARDARQFLLQP